MVVVRPLKKHIERTIDRTLDGAPSALVKGILLGQRRQLPELGLVGRRALAVEAVAVEPELRRKSREPVRRSPSFGRRDKRGRQR